MKKSILEVVHKLAEGLYDAGLMNVETMHTFDAMCLPHVRQFSPKKIKTKK